MKSLHLCYYFILGVRHKGVRRGSPWTRFEVGVRGPGVSVFGLPNKKCVTKMNGPDVVLTCKLNRLKISHRRKGAIVIFWTIKLFFHCQTVLYHD